MTLAEDVREAGRVDCAAPDTVTRRSDPVTVLTRRVMPFVLLGGVIVVLVRLAATPLHNFDTFFHLRFGHEFLEGNWSLRDPGSVTTFATADWVPTQWLPQVVMAQFEDWFGLAGVAWLSGVQFLALALTLWWVARRQADPIVAAPVVILALAGCASGMSMRPQVISFILVAVTAAVWIRAHQTARVPWHLVPLTWLWAMCHGMWLVGVVIGMVAVVGIALDRRARGRRLVGMAAVPIASGVAASFLTPVGPGLFSAVLTVNSRGDYFYEWATPSFTDWNVLCALALVSIPVLLGLRRGRRDWLTVLMLALAAAWLLYSLRTVPVAVAMVVPFTATALQDLVGASTPATRRERLLVLGGFATALLVLASVVSRTADQPPANPEWMDSRFEALPAGTKLLEETGFGGYLMWRFPHLDLMAHGYGDTYTDAELNRNLEILTLEPGWDDQLRETGIEYAVLSPDLPITYALVELEGWTVLEGDEDVQLLAPPPGWLDG
jgi:hypothetical protein